MADQVISRKAMCHIEIARMAVSWALTPLGEKCHRLALDYCSVRPKRKDGRVIVIGGLRGHLRRLFKVEIETNQADDLGRPIHGNVVVMVRDEKMNLKKPWSDGYDEFDFEFSQVGPGYGKYDGGIRVSSPYGKNRTI